MKLPLNGISPENINQKLKEFSKKDVDWKSGRVWSYVYYLNDEVENVAKNAYMQFLSENGLDVTAFPSLQNMENEIVGMCRDLLRGDENVCGSFTSGGTESLLLAIKSARDYAKKHKPEIEHPEMIIPETVHSSFFKGANYFGVKTVIIPVEDDYRVDPVKINNAITSNTILICASAPNYAFGVVDPITEIGKLAKENDILFHVDGCIGAFILSFHRLNGQDVTDFDFSVDGVTSISMDLHKYAYTPKGASVILYRNEAIRKFQYFVCNDWTGYTVVNPTILSSKSGGPIAAAWAVLNYIGENKYKQIAHETMNAANQLVQGIKDIEDIELMGNTESSMICFRPKNFNVYALADELKEKNWIVNLQFGRGEIPPNIHLTVTYNQVKLVSEFLSDLKECVLKLKKQKFPKLLDLAKIQAGKTLGASGNADIMHQLAPLLGIKDGHLPSKMAPINELLNDLPKDLSKELLLQFVSDMYKAK